MKNLKPQTELIRLDKRANRLRSKLGFSLPNALLLRARLPLPVSRTIVVEADGVGGAWVSMVEGNYPLDYQLYYERYFDTESEALHVATKVVGLRANPGVVLQPSTICPPRTHAERQPRSSDAGRARVARI